jgi:glucosylglycerate synthase
MAEDTLLSDDLLRQLMSVGEVDLLVAIPSHNNAATIGNVVEVVEETFQANYPRERVVIVNVDGGSKDDTPNIFSTSATQRNGTGRGLTSLRTEHRVSTNYASVPSQGLAYRMILAAADLLRAKACAVVSPATVQATPDWIRNLLQPVYKQQRDFVAPLYTRQKFDGLLARNVLYPMTRAVLGRGIRELQSTELAFSGALAGRCLNQSVWNEEAVLASPEIWMALTAISSDFQCCQSYLGPKVPVASRAGTDIVGIIRQTLGTLFWCLESFESAWIGRTEVVQVPTVGPDHDLSEQSTRVNRKRLYELFRSGVAELEPILQTILAPETQAEVQRIAAIEEKQFRFENELWAKTLYDFTASYHHAVLNRDHLIQAFVPLYRGRICSFLLQHQDSSQEEIEADAQDLCGKLDKLKPYLVERWKK